jgi:hypothetical protein
VPALPTDTPALLSRLKVVLPRCTSSPRIRKPTSHPMEARFTKVRIVLVAGLVLAVAGVWLGAWLRWGMRCDEGCYLRPTEPGEPWTRYTDSWQWHAQFALASLAVIAAGTALGTVRARPLVGLVIATVAAAFAGGWVGWYLATPLHQ